MSDTVYYDKKGRVSGIGRTVAPNRSAAGAGAAPRGEPGSGAGHLAERIAGAGVRGRAARRAAGEPADGDA